MKTLNKTFLFISAMSAMLGFSACAKTQTQAAADTPETAQAKQEINSKKAIVVYYSFSGNTRATAKQIASKIDADLFEIETKKTYPSEYGKLVKEAKKEIQDGFLPELKAMPENLADYSTVFVGSPNWWGTITPALSTFLKEGNFQGKTVIPFFTHGSGGMQNMAKDTASQLDGKGATILDAIAFRGDPAGAPEKDLDEWLKKLGFEIK